MRVLVIGSGGREHAIAWKLAQSPDVSALFCAPGNGGISKVASCVAIDATDITGLLSFCRKEKVDFVVVGPENALSAGIVDECDKAGILAFGPNREGSQIETSKVFAKNIMQSAGVPTAPFKVFSRYSDAHDYVLSQTPPYVVKADGLCAGKGAFVVQDSAEGEAALRELLVDRVHGEAGDRVIVEGFLPGVEVSYLAFSDGETIVPMVPSQDHKTLLDGDRGPNTGGMGAYAPAPFLNSRTAFNVDQMVMRRTVDAMRNLGIPYRGVLYAGLMMDRDTPYVLEFNARFGDPETQPILFKMKSDLLPILVACAEGTLRNVKRIQWRDGVSLCVVLASKGYPGKPETGQIITGLENLEGRDDILVFHAGTRREGNRFYTSGGRVLGVTVLARNYDEAMSKAYGAVDYIRFEGMQYRRDIGRKALKNSKDGRV